MHIARSANSAPWWEIRNGSYGNSSFRLALAFVVAFAALGAVPGGAGHPGFRPVSYTRATASRRERSADQHRGEPTAAVQERRQNSRGTARPRGPVGPQGPVRPTGHRERQERRECRSPGAAGSAGAPECRSARACRDLGRERDGCEPHLRRPNFEKIVGKAFRRELRVDYDSGLGFSQAAMRVLPTSRFEAACEILLGADSRNAWLSK